MSTVSGRYRFDEMAGMIPLAACPAGVLVGAIALLAWWRTRRRRFT